MHLGTVECQLPRFAPTTFLLLLLLQICREAYPPVVCVLLWVLCEVSIVALDLTMVLGE
jgi:Mn2+/Fe2+ NRAMP family transporter